MNDLKTEDMISAEKLRTRLKLTIKRDSYHNRQLQWFNHLERMEDSAY